MDREFDYEVFYAERVNNQQPIEWTLEHGVSFESYVDRMLKTQTIQCSNCKEVVLMAEFGDHYCKEYQQKETDDAQGNDEE